MTKRQQHPRGAIRSIAEVEVLIEQAKATERKIPIWYYDASDGTYLFRFITAESFVDAGGLHYFDPDGEECRTGTNFLAENGDGVWYLYTNYWFLFAHALKTGHQPKKFLFRNSFQRC